MLAEWTKGWWTASGANNLESWKWEGKGSGVEVVGEMRVGVRCANSIVEDGR